MFNFDLFCDSGKNVFASANSEIRVSSLDVIFCKRSLRTCFKVNLLTFSDTLRYSLAYLKSENSFFSLVDVFFKRFSGLTVVLLALDKYFLALFNSSSSFKRKLCGT